MKKINLRDLYFYINNDYEIEVSDEVYEVFDMYRKMEARYHSKRRYHNAFYSLDREDGIENDALKKVKSPEELFLIKDQQLTILKAIRTLPKKQAERIMLFFYEDMSVAEIARAQNVSPSSVTQSIMAGLKKLKKYNL